MAGGVNFEADGHGYVLRFGANELIALQDKFRTGEELQPLLALLDDAGLRTLRTFVWGGLLGSRPEITEAEAGEIITAYGIEATPDLIKQALFVAFPSVKRAIEAQSEEAGKGGEPGPPPKAAAKRAPGAGTVSSEPGAASG